MAHSSTLRNEQPGLLGLDPDIILTIADILPSSDIFSLCLTNSYLLKISRYALCRHITFDESRTFEQSQQRMHNLEMAGLLPAIRTLDVKGMDCMCEKEPLNRRRSGTVSREERQRLLDFFQYYLPRMIALKDFNLHGSYLPNEVLAILQSNPDTRLSVFMAGVDVPANLSSLQSSHNLHRLELQHTYTNADECLAVTRPLREILLTSPNLKKLKLDTGMPTSGCAIYRFPKTYHGLGFRDGEWPPPLEELELLSYPFATIYRTSSSSQPPLAGGREEKYWAEAFDWSRLYTLKTTHPVLTTQLSPHLPALHHLHLSCFKWTPALTTALLHLPSNLQTLAIEYTRGDYRALLNPILHHGPTLTTLSIHTPEGDTWKPWNDKAITNPHISRLRTHCPHLSTLTLDLPRRNSTWPYTSLNILAQFPNLQTLTHYFDLGDPKNPSQPYLTYTAAAHLFTYLRTHQPRLRKLTLHSGAPAPLGPGLPSEEALWPGQNTATFVCDLSTRDVDAAVGRFDVHCPHLGREENELLRRLEERYPNGKGRGEG